MNRSHKHLIWSKLLFTGIIFLYLMMLSGCSKKQYAQINIRLKDGDKSMLYLIELGNTGDKVIDSVKVRRSGKAKFHVPLKEPGYYQLRCENKQSITFVLSPDEKIKFTADYNNIYNSKVIEGSENTSKVNIIQDSLRSTIKKMERLKAEYAGITKAGGDTSKLKQLMGEYEKTLNTHKRFSIGFILNDLKSLANIAALFQEYSPGYYVFSEVKDMQFFKLVSDTLGKYYPDVKYVKLLNSNFNAMFGSYQTQRLLKLSKPGNNSLPDISLPDNNGTTIKLSSLRGKVVLLSFWSILNQDCIELNRDMMRVYKKYKGNNFEIFQVSIDNSRDAWLKTIKYEEIPWICVSDTNFPNSNLLWAYNINTVPLNYLISKNQAEILGKNLTPMTLERQLNQLLKN